MMNRLCICTLVLLAVFCVSGTCLAHKITLFGYVDQGMVKTEATFSGGRAAMHCQLSMITDTEPSFIGETDESGMLDFPIPQEKTGFDLIVTCGDGHRGTWRIEASELGGSSSNVTPEHGPPVVITPSTEAVNLRSVIREELQAELGPIKRQLAELKQDTITLADIMGGLGYFLGLAGLASYMRFRKDRN